ncbi:MAG TPA: site-specific DNA-methyltransferase [Pirellulales bacterium]|nr:site-specific DNA-methyltransferase [Pirellulales bacterium]
MATIDNYLGKVFHGDALDLLRTMAVESVDACIADPMYGIRNSYDWGSDPGQGDPAKHWQYHEPIYDECRRVLKPGGVMAWSASVRFLDYFTTWFGGHQVWILTRYGRHCSSSGNIWIVQTREQEPIAFPPDRMPVIHYAPLGDLKKLHPCQKTVEEMRLLVEELSTPYQIVLDCFCGIGATLIAAEQLGRRWIGCDLSRRYCQIALQRLANHT